MVDQLLLVFCDNVCIQIFSAVFCVTLNFTADTFKLASALGNKNMTPRDGKRRGGREEGGERDRGKMNRTGCNKSGCFEKFHHLPCQVQPQDTRLTNLFSL